MSILKVWAILLVAVVPLVAACQKKHEPAPGEKKLRVVTTLFPLYDFVRTIGGDRVSLSVYRR
ncbi:MAG TPA: hypothetical protein VK187_00565 [Geobacteraceae bacterium]|nr:hypothetical protein [Geobacteraceae bacterium]